MNGLQIYKDPTSSYAFCSIEYFSDEMKDAFRKRLVSICCGLSAEKRKLKINSYSRVVANLWERIKNKTDCEKIGLVGELLVHFIIQNELTDYQPASLYFNLEENSAKKGFDLVLSNQRSTSL